MLDSLTDQTLQPDAIYINVPMKNKRTGEAYVIPPLLEAWGGLTIQRTEIDYGPLTKLVPTVMRESDPDTIIIVIDDDQVYTPATLSQLAWYSEQDPNVAWGICGWSMMPYAYPRGLCCCC